MTLLLFLFDAAPTAPLQPLNEYQWIASLGVGGILAGGMFLYNRADRKESEARLARFAENFMTIVQDNTKAMTMLGDAIRDRR